MRGVVRAIAPSAITLLGLLAQSYGQGTMTFGFDGQPPGTIGITSGHIEAGMSFWNPSGPQGLATVGPGVSGFAQDGTGYLTAAGGAKLACSFNTFPGTYFNLVSFDAAAFSVNFPGPLSLEVVGYKGMIGTVTNYVPVDSLLSRRANNLPDFQTFYFGSQFQQVFRVDVLTDGWSLDNLVISGVPEPSAGGLIVLAMLCGFGQRWAKTRWSSGADRVPKG